LIIEEKFVSLKRYIVNNQIKKGKIMKNLLAIIQNPQKSEKFLEFVVNFAKEFKMNITTLYVQASQIHPHTADVSGMQTVMIDKNFHQEREKSLKTIEVFMNDLKKDFSFDMNINNFVDSGNEISIYKDFVNKNNIDLVLFKSNNDDSLLTVHSSNIDLIRQVECPLLIVPDNYDYQTPKKIVYATDYKDSDVKTLKEIIKLTKVFEPEITTLHITDSTDLQERAMKYGFKEVIMKDTGYPKIDVKVFKEEDGKDLGEFVNEIVIRMNADYLILLKENYNFFEKIFRVSATETIIQEANIPVWIFKTK
jgi:nucleotide-binding universal stress UspA family protein